MTVLLLANVGLRDVLLKGEKIEPAREEGRRVLDRFDDLAGDLSLPMLDPVVNRLLAGHNSLQLVLYGTDQPEDVPEEHRRRDTIHLAGVAVRLLERSYGRRKLPDARAKRSAGNPALYDDMLQFFRDQLSVRQKWTGDVSVCYVAPIGGTPAANMGMILAAVERFEECHVLYLPAGESHPVETDVGGQLRRATSRRLAAERLGDCGFGAAIPLLRRAGAPAWVVEVASYAADRYHFDFEAAASDLDRAKAGCGVDSGARVLCEGLRRGFLLLRDRGPRALLSELFHNAGMAWRRGEYAAFLGLVFRFEEAVLRYMVEELYPGLSTDVDDNVSRQAFRTFLEKDEKLHSYLKGQSAGGRALDLTEPTRPVLAAMLAFAWDKGSGRADEPRVIGFSLAHGHLQRLDRLSGLRNKSVIAHGFEGVSRRQLLERWGGQGDGDEPLDAMRAALAALGMEPGADPFQEAARLAVEGLRDS